MALPGYGTPASNTPLTVRGGIMTVMPRAEDPPDRHARRGMLVRFPEDTAIALRDYAEHTGQPVNLVIILAVTEYMRQHPAK
jgi:hypothetical protein